MNIPFDSWLGAFRLLLNSDFVTSYQKVNTSSHGERVLVRRSESGIGYPVRTGRYGAGPLHARTYTREAEASSDPVCVVVVTVYREEAFVGDLPERAGEVQRPADRASPRDSSRFVLNTTL